MRQYKYTSIFKPYVQKIIDKLKSNESKEEWYEEWSLAPTLFSNAGRRDTSGYDFSGIVIKDGTCKQKLKGSAVARDLRDLITEKARLSMFNDLFKGKTITIRLNKSFVLSVECKKNKKPTAQEECSQEKKSFPPIVDEKSEILILGTVPGNESIATGEYYAKKDNIFWDIMSNIYNDGKAFSTYEEKLKCVLKHHIAIWDVLHSCLRKGSTDKTIKNEKPNDIGVFLKQYPNIKKIVFNGKRALSFYKPSIPYSVALSTSPKNRINFSDEERTESWKQALL